MIKIEKIHQAAVESATRFKKSQTCLIESIQSVDANRVFQHKGFRSLFEYCVKALGLSESNSYALINIARKSVRVPELLDALKSGELTVSHAKTISAVITQESPNEWIEKAKTLSVKDLEKEVVRVSPRKATVAERVKPVSQDLSQLDCLLDKELALLLEQAQDLLSQKSQSAASIRETLRESLKLFVKKNSVLEKKLRNSPRGELIPYNQPLPARRKRQALQRDKAQCQASDPSGHLCGQKRWLDIHHIRPLSRGGTHELDNLITLCQGHHKLMHFRS